MKAAEWIDQVKAAKGWETDYRVAKELGFSRNTIGTYRSGRTTTMDEDTADKVATALNVPVAAILIDQLAERAKNPTTRETLTKLANSVYYVKKQSGKAIATLLVAVGAASMGRMA